MRIITLLNKYYPLKSFVYVKDQLAKIDGSESYVVDIIPLKNGVVKCSLCGLACSIYDSNKAIAFI